MIKGQVEVAAAIPQSNLAVTLEAGDGLGLENEEAINLKWSGKTEVTPEQFTH